MPKPEFLHLGLILGPDGKKLSKRHGDTSIADYRRQGYLPEALLNYLALLGWTHPEGKEEFSGVEELAWSGIRPASARALPSSTRTASSHSTPGTSGACPPKLRRRLEPFLDEPLPQGRELQVVEAIREDMRLLSDAPRLVRDLLSPVDPGAFAAELPESSDEVFARAARGSRLTGWIVWRTRRASSESCARGLRSVG